MNETPTTGGYIYVIAFSGYHKIGRAQNVERRIKSLLPTKFPEAPILKLSVAVDDSFTAERALHYKYSEQRVRGEWFNITDSDIETISDFLVTAQYLNEVVPVIPRLPPRERTHRISKPADSQKKERDAKRRAANVKAREAEMANIRDVPRLLRTMAFGDGFSVYGIENKAAVRSIERKFGYQLNVEEYCNTNGLHVCLAQIQGPSWIVNLTNLCIR